jgi:hypothetical protein
MSTVIDSLSATDKKLLIALYETQHYQALKHLIEATRLNIATQALDAKDFAELKSLQGQAYALKALHGKLKDLHNESERNKPKS